MALSQRLVCVSNSIQNAVFTLSLLLCKLEFFVSTTISDQGVQLVIYNNAKARNKSKIGDIDVMAMWVWGRIFVVDFPSFQCY